MAALDPKRWTKLVVTFLAFVVVGGLVASLASVAGTGSSSAPPTADTGALSTDGPSAADLEVLAADLSSGDRDRVLGALADVPIEAADQAFESLGSLAAVRFDAESLRYDEATQAALVDAELTASDGSVVTERLVLVERVDRWLVFSTLQQPGSTPIPTSG
jgi:hypothetical protein